METKICKTCGRELPIEMFYKNPMSKDGHINSCKDCQREKRRLSNDSKVFQSIDENEILHCPVCGKDLPASKFRVCGRSRTGRYWMCEDCQDYHKAINQGQDKNYFRKLRIKVDPEYRKEQAEIDRKSRIKNFTTPMLNAAKLRAKKKGLEFNLTKEDLVIPEICPILEVPFVYGTSKNYDYSPSLDRIDNSKGYTKDNVWIISNKANRMKNSSSLKELLIFCKNILRYSPNFIEEEDKEQEDKEPLG